jgi:oxalate---CoA ligase
MAGIQPVNFDTKSTVGNLIIQMDIRPALERQSQQNPNNFALLALERSPLTYSGLLTHCYRVLTDLNHSGISRGDRVAVVLPNGPEMAACMLAVAMGASCAPLNPNYRRSEFEFYLSDLAPRALIVEEGADLPPSRSPSRSASV